MKNKLSVKEQNVLDDVFATLEMCINNLAKNERLSLENIQKAIHYTYEAATGGCSVASVDESCKGKSHSVDFMQLIALNEKPMIDWSDVEGEAKEGGEE